VSNILSLEQDTLTPQHPGAYWLQPVIKRHDSGIDIVGLSSAVPGKNRHLAENGDKEVGFNGAVYWGDDDFSESYCQGFGEVGDMASNHL
jgi:hypothetical protein